MVQPRGADAADVHARPLADRLQTLENGDVLGGVRSHDASSDSTMPVSIIPSRPLGSEAGATEPSVGGGGSTGGGTTRTNWPRCSTSRPLPPRPVTSYFAVLIVCSRAPARLHGQQITVTPRGDEPEHPIGTLRPLAQLDQDHAATGTGEEVDLAGAAQHRAGLFGRDDDGLAPGRERPRRPPRRPPAGRAKRRPGPRARLDEDRPGRTEGCSRRSSPPAACTGGTCPSRSARCRVSRAGRALKAATTRSPSRNLKSRWIGSPYPVDAGTSAMRHV